MPSCQGNKSLIFAAGSFHPIKVPLGIGHQFEEALMCEMGTACYHTRNKRARPSACIRGPITCPSPWTSLKDRLPLKSLFRNQSQPVEEESQLPQVALMPLTKTNSPGDGMSPRCSPLVEGINQALHQAAASGYLFIRFSAKSWQGQIVGCWVPGRECVIERNAKQSCMGEQGRSWAKVQEPASPLSSGGLFMWSPGNRLFVKTRNNPQNKAPIWRAAGG